VTTGAGPGRTGRTTLLADDGPGPELIGYPVHLTVDDGSAAGLVFTSGPSLAGWDPGTGDRRWLGTTTGVTDAVLLGGTLYAAAAGRLVAVDATTGRVRWDVARAASGTGAALLTDGRQLLTLDPGARPRLLRTALDDGRTIGSTDLAPGVQGLVGADGHLVALDRADGLVLVLG